MRPINSSAFYGKTNQAWKEKLDKLTVGTVKKVLTPREFPKQQWAFDFVDRHCNLAIGTETLHVFAFETKKLPIGHRRYCVSSLSNFWEYYKRLPLGERHFYEVRKRLQ